MVQAAMRSLAVACSCIARTYAPSRVGDIHRHPEATAGYPHGCTAYAEAEPLFREAIGIGEKTLGRQHPTVVLFVRNFTGFLTQTGRDAEATALRARYGAPENGPE